MEIKEINDSKQEERSLTSRLNVSFYANLAYFKDDTGDFVAD